MTQRFRLAGVHIALVAMLLRALLPAGWMPNPTAADPFVICTTDGPTHVAVGSDGQPLKNQPDQNNDRSHEACPFAAAPHVAGPAMLAALSPPSLATSTASNAVHGQLTEGIAHYTPQSPRAPPSFV